MMKFCLLALACCLASRTTDAFVIPSSVVARSKTLLPMVSNLQEDLLDVNKQVKDVDISAKPSSSNALSTTATADVPPALEPNGMDPSIYTVNKVLIDTVYSIICFLYPVTGTERDFARFYVLETVARVPYFAYLSVLHLRETFGERYDTMSERMRTHYAEADNELHHLLIMEELGGNKEWPDRIVAQTAAFVYYWYVIAIYMFNEPAAYHLSELIEDHAYNTYSKFLTDFGDKLKTKPVPEIARKYYERDNPFLFDTFCTVKDKEGDTSVGRRQRPFKLENLYDVFVNIRDDEQLVLEHWRTLTNLVQYNDMNAVDVTEVKSTEPLEIDQD